MAGRGDAGGRNPADAMPTNRGGLARVWPRSGNEDEGSGLTHLTREPCATERLGTEKIGRASCRERVCQYVWISVVAVSSKKTHDSNTSQKRASTRLA